MFDDSLSIESAFTLIFQSLLYYTYEPSNVILILHILTVTISQQNTCTFLKVQIYFIWQHIY